MDCARVGSGVVTRGDCGSRMSLLDRHAKGIGRNWWILLRYATAPGAEELIWNLASLPACTVRLTCQLCRSLPLATPNWEVDIEVVVRQWPRLRIGHVVQTVEFQYCHCFVQAIVGIKYVAVLRRLNHSIVSIECVSV